MSGVLRAFIGYYFLVFIMRIAGRRPGKQMTPMEFVLIFFCGGLTLTTVVGNDRSLTNALCQIMALAMAHYSLAMVRQASPKLARIIDGTPLILLDRGTWQTETMKNVNIEDKDVMAMARDKGLERLDQIDYAILERNGEISIIETKE